MELNLIPRQENKNILELSGFEGSWGTMEKIFALKMIFEITLSNGTVFECKRAKRSFTKYHLRMKNSDTDLIVGSTNKWGSGINIINAISSIEDKYFFKRKGLRSIFVMTNQEKNELFRIKSIFNWRNGTNSYKIILEDQINQIDAVDLLIFFSVFLVRTGTLK